MYPLLMFTSLQTECNDVTFYVSCFSSAGYVAVLLMGWFGGFFVVGGGGRFSGGFVRTY